ncbi:MAG: RNA polymerase subunit AC19 [Cyphobasidiales sp. Tagirdzhanova-0007]|nr:MAG: RNA polymerase subunit AC19 [Cyphobasidiales sp. Tagirdzhanova-0007]
MERLDDQQAAYSAVPPTKGKKVEILPGAAADGSACTFCIYNEDHTLGNALRYIIMQNPEVEFCGYSAPHPSEDLIHLRVQMYDGKSAVEAVKEGLNNLETIFTSIREKYDESLEGGEFERFEDKVMDMEAVRKMKGEGEEKTEAPMEQ